MRILLLVQNYFPNTQSCARLFHDLAVELTDRGHEVLLTAPDESVRGPVRITREDGFTVMRVRSGRFRDVPRPLRAWNEWRLPATIWKAGRARFRDRPCGLIVSMSPTIFFAPLIERLKRLWGCPDYLVLRDIFPQWAVDLGLIRAGGPIHRFFRHYELRLYGAADVIGVMSKRNLEYFSAPQLSGRYRLEVLYNWAATEGQDVAETAYRRELGLEGKVVFFYGGNLGVAQDALEIVRLAEAMRHEPKAFFLVVGDGSEAEELRREAGRLALDNLRFLPPMEPRAYLGMVSEFDVGLLTLHRDLKTHNFPSKMLDYTYFGKPTLAAVNRGNDLRQLIEERRAGLACWSGERQELAEGALRLTRDDELRRELGRNSRQMMRDLFSAARAADQVLACLPRREAS